MSKNSTAKAVEIEFDKNKEFVVRLTGAQVKLLLQMVAATHFKGSEAFLIGDTISALQKPFLEDAHGADPDDGSPSSEES